MYIKLKMASMKCSIWLAFILAVCATISCEDGIADSFNDFGMNLHRSLLKQLQKTNPNGNLFYSPFSIGVCLGMVYAGAEGKTKTEIASVMGWGNDKEEDIYESIGKMLSALQDGQTDFKAANRVFIDKSENIKLKKDFRKTLENVFGNKIKKIKFSTDPDEARKHINSWVEKHTGNKIKDMIPSGGIDANTLMVLINAVYFKGFWKHPFDKQQTMKRTFTIDKSTKTHIAMMRRVIMAKYISTRESENSLDLGLQYEAIELDYVDEIFSMVILLPEDSKGLATLENKLSSAVIKKIVDNMKEVKLTIFLPKFKLTNEYELHRVLPGMGLETLFTTHANLTGMLKGPEQIFVTQALHKAFIEVNEKGTEASAATAMMSGRSFLPTFDANRPFVFFIRDKRSNIILFSGRFSTPEEK